MKVFELREKTHQELTDYLAGLKREQFNLRMRRSAQELPNPLRLRTLRREIAQVITILNEDTLGIRRLLEAKPRKEKEKEKEKEKGKKDAKTTDRRSKK